MCVQWLLSLLKSFLLTDVIRTHREKLAGRVEVVRDGETSDSGGSVDTDGGEALIPASRDSSTSRDAAALREADTLQAKRGHVMRELIDTERAYVTELQNILEGYAAKMDSEEMQDLVPSELGGQRHVLFGNMDELYNFHSTIFLKDLENCRNTPGMVGKCFVARKEEFQMYSIYCQNKQRSEALCRVVGDGNPFFKECQKRLSHRLPLGAYLLKPVQRITKYQLLLKEMLRYTQDPAGSEDLQEALDTMLSVLKYVNDIMHQVGITGFNGNIADAGRLLMQGSFNVWTAHKKDKIRDIRFKPMQRHIFLYANLIMFCKKKDDPQSIEKAAYIFKNSLDTASIGMTENVKGDKKKFEIWLRGRAEVYICQAPNEPTKNLWVKEIKKVLFNQFDQLKDKHKKEIPTIPVSSSSEPVAFEPGSNYQVQTAMDNSANNNPNNQQSAGGTVELGRDDSLPESRTTDEYSDDAGWTSDEYEDQSGVDPLSYLSHEQALALQAEYVALADYNRVDAGEISMKEGDLVEVLKVGNEGWWYVRVLSTSEEGWAPASYLDSVKRRSSHSTFSMSSSGKSPEED